MQEKYLKEIVLAKSEQKYQEAIELGLKGYKIFRDNCFLNEVVECYIAQKQRKKAIDVLQKMIKTEKDNSNLYQRLAYNYFVIGNFKQALKYYKLLLNFNNASSTYNFNVGNMYHFLKDYKNAFKYYTNAINLNGANLSALNNLGLVYYETKDWQEAQKIFNAAIRISDVHPEAYHHMGIIYRDFANDLELSELYLQKAIRLDPKHLENHYQLALTFIKENKTNEAKEKLEYCLQLNPKHKNSQKLLQKIG